MALNKTARTLVANVSNTVGSTTRGRLDMNAVQGGGFLTIKMVTGGTDLTLPCICNVLIAHNAALPAAASAGADWKTIASYSSGITAGKTNEQIVPIDPAIMCLEVEFTGNTGQPCQVEAYLSELTAVA